MAKAKLRKRVYVHCAKCTRAVYTEACFAHREQLCGYCRRGQIGPQPKEIECACGCGSRFFERDQKGRIRKYVSGHNPISRGEHVFLHCAWCNKMVERTQWRIRTYRRSFCSRSCNGRFNGRKLHSDDEYKARQRVLILAKGNKPPVYHKENHPRWKGGITSQNRVDRASLKSKNWRRAVFDAFGYRCGDCGVKGIHLHAHHIKPWSEYPEFRYELSNGIALCVPCHGARHGRRLSGHVRKAS